MDFKDLKSAKNDGRYEGQIDTGANTPAMQTKYAVNEGMPIWKLRRPIMVDTAGGIITCSYATVVSVLNTFNADNPYWMTTIFYLIDDLPIEILIDRRTMRLLGLDVQKMSKEKYTHTESYSQTWMEGKEADDLFYEQLIDPSTLNPHPSNQNKSDDIDMDTSNTTGLTKVTKDYGTFHTRNADPPDTPTMYEQTVIDAKRKIKGMDLIHRSFDNGKYDFVTEPLHSNRPDQFARYKAVDKTNPKAPIVVADLTLPNVDVSNNINYLKRTRAMEEDGYFMDPNLRLPNESISPSLHADEIEFDTKAEEQSKNHSHTTMSALYQSALDDLFIESTAQQRDNL